VSPLRHLAAALLGAAVALAAVAVHRQGVGGLLLAWAASVATAWRLGRSAGPRGLALSFAGGWLVLLALVLTGRPEGDYAVASDLAGYALMAAGVAVLAVGVASLRRLRA
jgi:hypothetical protein